jgi:hypothetical protein
MNQVGLENVLGIIIDVWRVLRRVLIFAATALAVYTALVLVSVVVMVAEGSGISCYEVCSPTQEWLSDAAPWPRVAAMIFAGLAGLIAAWPFRD